MNREEYDEARATVIRETDAVLAQINQKLRGLETAKGQVLARRKARMSRLSREYNGSND